MEEIDPLSSFSLDGQVALVTGASSGLGERFARVLAAAGARVVLAARREARIRALAQELPEAIAVGIDLGDDAELDRLVETAIDSFGHVDVLVNNAGTTNPVPAFDEDPQSIRDVLNINLVAPFLLGRRVAREMSRRGGGSIINIASINAVVGSRVGPEASYCASKGGLAQLTRELANQWAKENIRVNAIGPGYFETEMTAELFANEAGVAAVRRHTPMRRPGRIDELDGTLLFLASSASSYMTGQLLIVDGGWTVI